jgi:hypothetical protein
MARNQEKASRQEKGSKPVFNARAKTSADSDFMITIGAAWEFRDGEGYVVKLQTLPMNWDGSFILVPPREPDAAGK